MNEIVGYEIREDVLDDGTPIFDVYQLMHGDAECVDSCYSEESALRYAMACAADNGVRGETKIHRRSNEMQEQETKQKEGKMEYVNRNGICIPVAAFVNPHAPEKTYALGHDQLVFTFNHDNGGVFEYEDGTMLGVDFETMDAEFIVSTNQVSPSKYVSMERYAKDHGIRTFRVVREQHGN